MKRYIVLLIITVLSVYNLKAQNIECIGNTIEIPLSGSRNESVQWQFSTNEIDWINLPGANAKLLVYNIIETGYFRAKVLYGECEYYSDTTYIEAYSEPTIANAGVDQGIATEITTITLSANTPSIGKGKWTIMSGMSGSFENDTLPTTRFTGDDCNDYVLQWSIATECNSSADEVNISFRAKPTIADAGPNQIITNADTTIILSANIPLVGTGKWKIVSGLNGEYSNANNPTASFTGNQCSNYTLRWAISTECSYSQSDVSINFNAEPTIADAGVNQSNLDGSTTVILDANVPLVGSGLWTVKTGISGSFSDPTSPNTSFSGILNEKYILTWTISTACKTNTDEVNINIYDPSNIALDYEGNIYKTVAIGTQKWMAENLKATKYNDGENIALVTGNAEWVALSTPAYCWYNNDAATFSETYGALYNWYTVNTEKLCPLGWHVPLDTEWFTLINSLGDFSTVGNKLKESGTIHWHIPNTGATNETGFTALPAGLRNCWSNGLFSGIGTDNFLWSSTEFSISNAIRRELSSFYSSVTRSTTSSLKQDGLSVRCVKNGLPTVTTDEPSAITSISATCGGNVTFDGGAPITARGVCWGTTTNPTITDSKTTDGAGIGAFTSSITGLTEGTTYYLRTYATNNVGIAYGNEVIFITSVTDIEGNVYKTVKIGSQVWMVENLKTAKYNDNTPIPLVEDAPAWAELSSPGYCWYNNDSTAYKATYGALYNWYTLSTDKLCPTGWHVPSDAEWKKLEMYLGMKQAQADAKLFRGTDQGTQLKNITGWNTGGSGTNISGFSALPGGYREFNGAFFGLGGSDYWWSSTEGDTINAWCRGLEDDKGNVYRYDLDKRGGFSVRCLKD